MSTVLARCTKATMRAVGWHMDAGPCSPSSDSNFAGVGVITIDPLKPITFEPKSDDFADAVHTGRLKANWIDIMGTNILFVNAYCWSGGSTNDECAQKTDDLMFIIKTELDLWPEELYIVATDLNARTDRIPTVHDLVTHGDWVDVGLHADLWGELPGQPTCQINDKAAETRIDYLFVCRKLMPAVDGFRVHTCDSFPTHQPIQMLLHTKRLHQVSNHVKKRLVP